MKEILDVIHKTIYQFFDVCEDDEEVPMSDKDKLLLEVNKAICNNLKALEKEPCEDCISRERVLLEINRIGFDAFTSYDYYSNLYDFVAGLSSEEPERKKGKWIWDKRTGTYHCSECGHDPLHEDVGEIEEYKYCMNCGAEMEVDE